MAVFTVNECFCEIKNGVNIKQGIVDGGYPITRIETLADNQFNRNKMGYAGITDLSKYKDYILSDGDLLMSHINSPKYLGRTVMYRADGDEKIIHGMNLLRLKVRRGVVDPAYAELLFYAPKVREQIGKITKKSVNQASFSVTDLKRIKVDLPSMKEQIEVVKKISKLKHVLSLKKEKLEKLDLLIKARFVEMFGDPISNPKSWEMVPLGELTEIGSSKRIFEKEYVDKGIPFYRTKEIVELSKRNSISTELFITEERFSEIKEKYGAPKKDDLLISAVGTIGTIWVVDGKNDFYFKDGNLIRVDSSEKFNSVYMKYLLENLIAEHKKQMSSGTAYAALTISELTKMSIFDAPKNFQEQFAIVVKQIDKSKVTVQKSLDEIQLLFDSLIQKYFEKEMKI